LVAIDILDEDHSLWLAMSRLALCILERRSPRRASVGTRHTVTRMADDYERVMARATSSHLRYRRGRRI
jgi:hypothetical protein